MAFVRVRERTALTYAIVQLDLTPPPVEAVRAALAHTKGLLPGDAARLAKDAYGILADRLSEEDADAIRQGLAGQNAPSTDSCRTRRPRG